MFAGQLACEAVNFALKRLIKEERPRLINNHGQGYGMPSSHAQFIAFWAVALTLFLVVRHRPAAHRTAVGGGNTGRRGGVAVNGSAHAAEHENGGGTARSRSLSEAMAAYPHRSWSLLERGLASLFALGLAAAVAWSRIYLNYHTPKQVLVGCLAGALSAIAWFAVTAVVRQIGLLAWAIEIPVARWFRVRDLIVEEDLCQAGWEKWEDKQAAAQQRKGK